jgi:hypothetical protein
MKTVRILAVIVLFLVGWCVQSWYRATIWFIIIMGSIDDGYTKGTVSTTTAAPILSSSLSSSLSRSTHVHRIPNILIFTHYENLLLLSPPLPSSVPSSVSSLTYVNVSVIRPTKEEEQRALRNNIQHTISLHPDATIRFLTDDDCLTSIRNVVPYLNLPPVTTTTTTTTTNNTTTASAGMMTLMRYFMAEPVGMFKADLMSWCCFV